MVIFSNKRKKLALFRAKKHFSGEDTWPYGVAIQVIIYDIGQYAALIGLNAVDSLRICQLDSDEYYV